jgi:hypothetical protein
VNRARIIGAIAVAVLLAGCGSGSAHNTDAATTTLLRRDMTALASAAASRNYASAATALAALNADAATARDAGKLTDDQLAQIRAAATTVQADLTAASRAAATTAAAPTVTPTPKPTPTKSKHKDAHSGGNGQGGGPGGG